MFLKKDKKKDGRTYLSIVRGFRDPVTKKTRSKTVVSLGYLEDFLEEFDDPIVHFTQVAKEMTEKEKLESLPLELSFNLEEEIPEGINRKNIGFIVLSFFYHTLEIDSFWNNRQRTVGTDFNLNQIFQAIVYLRALQPASKKATYEAIDKYFLPADFELHDLYRALSIFTSYKDDLILHIHELVRQHFGRDLSKVYYDVTNYYFEIPYEDNLRKRGYSKENRKSPIVQMGLLLDKNGLPITYELFPGNTSDNHTFMPTLHKLKDEFNLGRVIVVADKAMNTGENIAYNTYYHNGYIFSQTVRGADKKTKDYILNKSGYKIQSDNFKIKSRTVPTKIRVRSADDKIKLVQVDQKQVIYYSKKYADKAKRERERLIHKTLQLIQKGQTIPPSSVYKYIKKEFIDSQTGEIIKGKSVSFLDEERLKEEAKYDGYYMIVTSELDMPDEEIISAYHKLWQIEDTFKVTKSDLEARPVYLSRADRIEAHFLTCFVSLMLLRLLELELGDDGMSLRAAIHEMQNMTGTYLDLNYYLFDYYNDNVKALGDIVGIDFSKRLLTLKEINNMIASVKK